MTELQQPLLTPFGPFSTAEAVAAGINLAGKTAIVTGGASNLGLETVKVLSSHGALVVVPTRDVDAARAAFLNMQNVELCQMDLLEPSSIDRFASTFMARETRLDLLILSAGVMATPLFRDANGHEGQFSINHLGHFRLTCRLWPALKMRLMLGLWSYPHAAIRSVDLISRSRLQMPNLRQMAGLRSVQDGQRPVRGGARCACRCK